MILLYIILASLSEMLVALTGILFLFIGSDRFKKYLPHFVSFSVGAFLSVIFLSILPEAIEKSSVDSALSYALAGFLFFFLLSRFLHWYHHHEGDENISDGNGAEKNINERTNKIKSSGYLVLYGDILHNAIDGVIIALAFIADVNLGITTTVAVLFHEFPQEAVDFFVMIGSGFSRGKALFYNMLVSSSTLIVAVLVYFLAENVTNIDKFIGPALGIVAGNFLYLAASDLIPELHERHKAGASTLRQFSLILFGVIVMYIVLTLIPK